MQVYLVQNSPVSKDKKQNFAQVLKLLEDAAPKAGGLIVLPEMFATGYVPENPEEYAEDFMGNGCGSKEGSAETAEFLQSLASKTGCAVLGAGIQKIEGTEKGVTNHSVLYLPGLSAATAHYDKIHSFFTEQKLVTPGNKINLFTFEDFKIGTAICYDIRFPELFREMMKAGATAITVQSAWPMKRLQHWETLLTARAIENQVFVLAVNSCGTDCQGGVLAGNSMIISPDGRTLARAEDAPTVLEASIQLSELEDYRKNFPVLQGLLQ